MFVSLVAERLRVFLQDGDLRSFFFNRQFGNVVQEVPAAYWARPESAAMLQRVFFDAFEIQSSASQPVPADSIYFSVSDLTEILQPGFAKKKSVLHKKPLPKAQQRKLVDALRSIVEQNEGIRREKQFKLLEELPEFRDYWITDSDFRAAAKNVPVKRGRPQGSSLGHDIITAEKLAEILSARIKAFFSSPPTSHTAVIQFRNGDRQMKSAPNQQRK
jgi:hypothetical protein